MDVEEFQPTEKWFLKLTLQTKWITPSERALETVPKNGVRSCVPFHLRSLGLWKDVKDAPVAMKCTGRKRFRKQYDSPLLDPGTLNSIL